MADTGSISDLRDEMTRQIVDLKKEVSKVSESLKSRASDAADEAGDMIDAGRKHVRQVQGQAQLALDAARDNPGTATAVLCAAGLLGVAVGVVLGGMFASESRRR